MNVKFLCLLVLPLGLMVSGCKHAPPGTKLLETLPLGSEDREKLLNGNARRLLKL